MKFKIGSKIQWKWLGRLIDGQVVEVHTEAVTKTIKGKKIKRNGTEEKPAYLVKSNVGNLALKLETELSKPAKKTPAKKKTSKPAMFRS